MNRFSNNTTHAPQSTARRAFSMVELLVVIAIIGVLVAMLLPAIQFARAQARFTQCNNNLRQIGLITHMYRDVHAGRFPDAYKTGNWNYRMAPGLKTANDIAAFPEKYGLEAVFVNKEFLPPLSGIWVCASQKDEFMAHQNTYAFSRAGVLSQKNPANQDRAPWVWDNYNFYPGLSGYRGPFSSYTVPTDKHFFPHAGFGEGTKGYNCLYLDGHVEFLDN